MRRPLRSRSRMFIADYWRLDYGEGIGLQLFFTTIRLYAASSRLFRQILIIVGRKTSLISSPT